MLCDVTLYHLLHSSVKVSKVPTFSVILCGWTALYMELWSSDIIIKSCEKRMFPNILLPHWLIQVLSHLGRMAFCLWPFCSPPPPNKTLFSSLPAWVTVGLDFTPEEFIALFHCELDHGRSMAFCITEKLFPYLSAVLAGFVVYHFFKAYKRRQFTSLPVSVSSTFHRINHRVLTPYQL